MNKRKMSLRARLLVLQLIVFGALILLASPITYLVMSRTLHRDRDEYLVSLARNASEEYAKTNNSSENTLPFPPRCLPESMPPSSPAPGSAHRPRHLLVCDQTGKVLCSDGESEPLAPEAVHQAFETFTPAFADQRWSAEILRLIAWPFKDQNGQHLVMEVGTSYRVIEGVLGKGLVFLLIFDAVALLLLIAGSYLLTRGAFLPIDQVIRRVEQIDEANLAERLPLDRRSDEVARLVTVVNHMLGRLERAFEAQSRFSSDVAHEVRSPLTALRGQIEVALRRRRSEEEYRRVLEESLEEVLRLSRLAEDLMSLAKADAGVLHARKSKVELRELLNNVLRRFKAKAHEKNIHLHLEASEAVTVDGDPGLIGRMVENLVDNALIHTHHMGEIHVRLQKKETQAVISVEDNGAGIPSEHLSKIFDRFYRIDPARSREMGGIGLGLAISRQIALLHDGTIQVQSTLGKGSIFSITIPIAPSIKESLEKMVP
ncbi:MAG: heavy metal sensor histidine kinase [Candidatus Latescibacteria bacterium]|nr:heavy metal sensor histidine kinase [Candidatus Latescibacterota bacterium]NIO55292.1 heavy metal sensor histidine kinase [Candidatus Latescibacterota bacterium]